MLSDTAIRKAKPGEKPYRKKAEPGLAGNGKVDRPHPTRPRGGFFLLFV